MTKIRSGESPENEEHHRAPSSLAAAWLVIVLLLPIAWLGLFRNLGAISLQTSDEAAHTQVARNMLKRGDFLTPWYFDHRYYGKPPLKIWLTAGLMRLFGDSEWVIRIPDATFAAVMGLLVVLLALRHYGAVTAFAAGVIFYLAPYPMGVHGWRQGVQDSPLSFLMTTALFLFAWRGGLRGPPKAGLLLLLGFLIGCASLVKSVVAFLTFSPIVLYLLLSRRSRELWRKAFIAAGILSILPWLWWYWDILLGELTWNFEKRITGWRTDPHPASAYWTWLWEGMEPFTILLPLGLLLAIRAGFFRRHPFDKFLAIWSVAFTLPWPFAHLKHPWYLYPAYPALALLAARTIFPPELRHFRKSGRRKLLALLLGLLFLAGTRHAVLHAWEITGYTERVPFHVAVDWLCNLPTEERTIGVFLDPRSICPDERYYLDRSKAAIVYLNSFEALVSMAVQEQHAYLFIPRDVLPRLLKAIRPKRNLQREVMRVESYPRCRRARGVGRLPWRMVVVLGFEGRADYPKVFYPLPPFVYWSGFGRPEHTPARTLSWIYDLGKIWFPYEICGTLRGQLTSFHRPRRVQIRLPGSFTTERVPVKGIHFAVKVDTPPNGGFGAIRVFGKCERPVDVAHDSLDKRCLSVSLANPRLDPEKPDGD